MATFEIEGIAWAVYAGGDWTNEKLERVRKYLVAYATIMRNQNFRFAYIDAFAGTGYNTPKAKKEVGAQLFPELGEVDATRFLDGSARIALKVEPRFTKYLFIEKDSARFAELGKLKEEFPALASDIVLINAAAALWVAGSDTSPKACVANAAAAIDSRAAQRDGKDEADTNERGAEVVFVDKHLVLHRRRYRNKVFHL